MAKKTKETVAKKPAKVAAPVDPVKSRNLVRLLNSLALLLAIAAFLLQLFAVLTHHWKWQRTSLQPLVAATNQYPQPNVYEDSRLEQNYGLYSREVKLYANNDEQLDVWASTRFPRPDDGEASLHNCLSQTSTLRGALLTCSNRVVSLDQCHCRRYAYWNFVIFFEIAALVLLGIVVFLVALQNTQLQGIVKPAAAGLALIAFIFLLVGLILILSHLKRETRSIADVYPHTSQRFNEKLSVVHDANRARQYFSSNVRRDVRRMARRQAHETYRAYSLLPGQHPYNETHYQEYSEQQRAWIYVPYTRLAQAVPYAPLAQRNRATYPVAVRRNTTTTPVYSEYGPLLGYDRVFDNTRARIGWSTILSILAAIPALLLPLLLILSWLTAKKLVPNTKTVTTTSVKTEYVPVPQEVTVESVPQVRAIPSDYDSRRPIGDAVVTTQNVPRNYDNYGVRTEPVIVRDVVIRDDQSTPAYGQQYAGQARNPQEHNFPVNVESTTTSYRT